MAARFLNNVGRLGIGLAIAGGVVNSALYNGMICFFGAGSAIDRLTDTDRVKLD